MSTLAWLAYSDAERRSALDVISLFKERDMRDQLSISQHFGEAKPAAPCQAPTE